MDTTAAMHKKPHTTKRKHHTKEVGETTHIFEENQPQIVGIINRYSKLVSLYKAKHPTDYDYMIASTSGCTDSHVLSLLGTMGLYSEKNKKYKRYGRFEADVLLLTKVIWNTAMMYPGMHDMVGDHHMLNVHTVINRLNANGKIKVLETIYDIKQHYIALARPVSGARYCSVLTCWTVLEDIHPFTMNSMRYCDYHKGLALFNGLRHSGNLYDFCAACGFWNTLALKSTCGDPGHNHYSASTLSAPYKPKTTNMSNREANVNIRWHKAKGTPAYTGWGDTLEFNFQPMASAYEHRPKYFSEKFQKIRYVPRGSVVTTPLNANGLVNAWVQARGYDLRTNRRRYITDLEYITDIFQKYRAGGNPMAVDQRSKKEIQNLSRLYVHDKGGYASNEYWNSDNEGDDVWYPDNEGDVWYPDNEGDDGYNEKEGDGTLTQNQAIE